MTTITRGDTLYVHKDDEDSTEWEVETTTIAPTLGEERIVIKRKLPQKSELEKFAIAHAKERCPGQDESDIVFSMCVDDYVKGAIALLEYLESRETSYSIAIANSESADGYRDAIKFARKWSGK